MNLSKLFAIQAEVDEPYKDVPDRLSKDILWLQTELGELANEWRGFKYRRPDEEQQPITKDVEPDIELFDKSGIASFIITNPLLEEYTDCLSIILSIGLQRGFVKVEIEPWKSDEGVNDQFNGMFRAISNCGYDPVFENYDYEDVINIFLGLGSMLGFTWEQIESNYLQKAEANKRRNAQ